MHTHLKNVVIKQRRHLETKHQALAYTRVRYVGGGDFGRTERQRKVLEELIAKAKTMSASKLSKFSEKALRLVSTNLTELDVMSLLMGAPDYLNYDIEAMRIPIDGTYHSTKIQGAYVILTDYDKNLYYWYNRVYLDKDVTQEIADQIAKEKAKEKQSTETSDVSSDVSPDEKTKDG